MQVDPAPPSHSMHKTPKHLHHRQPQLSPQPQPRHTKRPRFIVSSISEKPVKKSERLTPPYRIPDLNSNPRPPNADKICAFCRIQGSVPECEGTLLGPFTYATKKGNKKTHFYAHKACAVWAPEAYENKHGQMVGVDIALARAKLKKCIACLEKGASLACMHGGSRCCRGYHFRCALRSGVGLLQHFSVMCHNHYRFTLAPPQVSTCHEITPIDATLLRRGNSCTQCNGDSYDINAHGHIMSCNNCFSRVHTKCIIKNVRDEAASRLLINCFKGGHYCDKCMICALCEKRVDQQAYGITRRRAILRKQSDIDLTFDQENTDDCNLLLCSGCNHFAVHIDCLPKSSDKTAWRCNACRYCIQCMKMAGPYDGWNELYQACGKCYLEISNGAITCPVCMKMIRDGEEGIHVACDGCQQWVHADTCAGLTTAQFNELTKDSKKKYFCPKCVEKKRDKLKKSREKNGSRPFLSQQKSISNAQRAVLQKIPPPSEEHAFYSVHPANKDNDQVLSKSLNELAVDIDICRRCCSGSTYEKFRFCITCGDSFHECCSDGNTGLSFHLDDSGQMVWQCGQCRINWDVRSYLQSHPKANGTLTHVNGGSNKSPSKINLYWEDDRRCELCGMGESKRSPEGRLLVWSSIMNSDLSDSWVHVGCIMWSNGMMLHRGEGSNSLIVGPRRALLTTAKRTRCGKCGKPGATIKCSASGCRKAYHFHCAGSADLICAVAMKGGPKTKKEKNDKRNGEFNDVEIIVLFCPKHTDSPEARSGKRHLLFDAHKKNRPTGMIRVIDEQGIHLNPDAAKKRVISMNRSVRMRVGPITVIHFGEVVPEVDDFIIDRCLVPLGFSAVRRFWSMKTHGKQCAYFMEVGGHSQTGPLFAIRSAEDMHLKLEGTDLDNIWGIIWRAAMKVQLGRKIFDEDEICRSGLDMFGLNSCEPVVRHIESLPLAGMFNERYKPRCDVEAKNNDVSFYESLSRKYRSPKVVRNHNGCARVEGYQCKLSKAKNMDGPMYENMRSGCTFQLEIARDILFNRGEDQNADELRCTVIPGTCEKPGERKMGRPRRATISDAGTNGNQGSGQESTDAINAFGRKRKRRRTAEIDGEEMLILEEEEERIVGAEQTLASVAKSRTKILRSEIEGWGVFATKDIGAGELIIEYVGEVIRPPVSDVRERRYLDQGVGCYMFEVVPGEIVDATMTGNAARYINHSCAPNCYSKTVWAERRQKQVVAIFSKRRIQRGEELSYDYQFPFDDADRVVCGCGAAQCKGFMN